MRFLLMIILCVWLIPAHSADNAGSKYDTGEQEQLVAALQSDVDLIRSKDIQEIRDFIQAEDADFIYQISDLPDDEQITSMRSWLARRAFYFYYDTYMAEMQEKSKQTGRAVKTTKYDTDDMKSHSDTESYRNMNFYYWLDRGVLDEKKCEWDLINRIACDYPDGFEEYEITRITVINRNNPDDNYEHMVIIKDDVASNSTKLLNITLTSKSVSGDNDFYYDLSLSVGGQVEKYTDRHRWRNQEVADIRAGKYIKASRAERAKYKNTPFSLHTVVDTSRQWQSQWLPDAAVISLTGSYNYSHTNAQTEVTE